DEFEAKLDRLLPASGSEPDRQKILLRARQIQAIQFDRDALVYRLSKWLVGCLVVLLVATWRVDVNLFSLHGLYSNRLVRAYLGASQPQRKPDPVTGFDPNDDLSLAAAV